MSLPTTAPNTERHCATLDLRYKYKYAVYTIAELNHEGLNALQDELNSAHLAADTCKLAPKPNFSGRTLRDVYDYHIYARDEDMSIHPLFFIVATDVDYKKKGVTIVHLDTFQDEQADRVDKGNCSVDMAASWGMNIDIGNMAWEDLKEEEEQRSGQEVKQRGAPSDVTQREQPTPNWQYAWWGLVENGEACSPYPKILNKEKVLWCSTNTDKLTIEQSSRSPFSTRTGFRI